MWTISSVCHMYRCTWTFAWTVEIPTRYTNRRSNSFSFKGHEVHLEFGKDCGGVYYVELHAPPSFPSCEKRNINVQVETKDKAPVPLTNNYGFETNNINNNKTFWYYSNDKILAAHPDFFKDGVVTFLVCDVDPPKADKCTDTSQDWTTAPDFSNLSLSNDILDGKLMNLNGLSSDFANLLTSGEASDVQLNCKGITRPVHRTVLAARSQVFSAMFQHKMAESATGIVDIGDLNAEVLDLFLQYVYSGKLPNIPEDKMHELYVAADKYSVHCLKKLCSDWMVENLSADNFTTFLMTADIHSHSEFKNTLIESIADHSEWLGRAKWLEFSKEHPILAVEVFQKHYDKRA